MSRGRPTLTDKSRAIRAPSHGPSVAARLTLPIALLLFVQSLTIHRHEKVIQRLSQRWMGKDAVAKNGTRQLPHHGDLQHRHHFAAFHAQDRATQHLTVASPPSLLNPRAPVDALEPKRCTRWGCQYSPSCCF